ncbi:hypothetical protein IJ103_00035 [Candidatus Saccharibacteria bacterium]|nr:hypothetical protein [Candidatus Saccharibacteria bacterium]
MTDRINDARDLNDALFNLFARCSEIATTDRAAESYVRAYMDAGNAAARSLAVLAALRTLAGRGIAADLSPRLLRSIAGTRPAQTSLF